MKIKKKLINSLVALGSTALVMGICEIGSRFYTASDSFLLSHNPVIFKQSEGSAIFEPHKKYGHLLINNSFVGSDTLESLDETVKRVTLKKAKDTILNLGDSSTSGWNSDKVTENIRRSEKGLDMMSPFFTYATYSDILEKNEEISSINAGIPGYTSDSGKRRIRDLLQSFRDKGVTPNVVTIYFGNNDSVWNANVQDEQLFPEFFDSHLFTVIKEKFDKRSSTYKTVPRVSVTDYESNLVDIINTIREYGAQPILIEPVIPKHWYPGLRARGQLNEDDLTRNTNIEAIRKLQDARKIYQRGVATLEKGDQSTAEKEFAAAQNLDFYVPRIKPEYVDALKRIASETNTTLVSVKNQIPVDDRKYFIDYCHPLEPVNKMIADAVANEVRKK